MPNRKLRVLHVSTWKTACGIATYCENLVNALAGQNVDSGVVALRPTEWNYYLPEDVHQWQSNIVNQAKDYDLVHFQHEHGLYGHSRSSRFATKQFGAAVKGILKLGKPVVSTFHTDIIAPKSRSLKSQITKLRRKWTWQKYVTKQFGANPNQARAIVHTLQTRLSFARHGMSSSGIHIIPHACLPPRQITVSREYAKEELNFQEDCKLLTVFGFLGKYKGHDLAIKALEYMPENYHLALVGGMHPEARDSFLDDVIESIPENLKHRVRVTGWVDTETAGLYYAASDACVAPYRGDTELSASGAITWALSSGRPVIASKIEAFQAVDRSANCMFLVTPERLRELAWAAQKVVEDEPLAERLVENSRQYCLNHSWEQTAVKTRALYEQMLGMNPASSQHRRAAA